MQSERKIIIKNFSYLPNDLINIILDYTNIIVYRNGKYINRINNLDVNYSFLKKVPRPIKISEYQYYIGLRDKGRKVIKISLHYLIQEQNIMISTSENHVGQNGLIYGYKHKDDIFI